MAATNLVDTMLCDLIAESDHPEIVAVLAAPSGEKGWCRVQVRFADGASVYIGVETAR